MDKRAIRYDFNLSLRYHAPPYNLEHSRIGIRDRHELRVQRSSETPVFATAQDMATQRTGAAFPLV